MKALAICGAFIGALVVASLFAVGSLAEMPMTAFGVTVIGPSSCGSSTTGLRCGDLTSTPGPYPYMLVGGYAAPGDGGGGYFALGPSGCQDNGGSVIRNQNFGNPCYYRMSSPNDVRQWGAHCDVVPAFNTGSFTGGGSTFNFGSANVQSTDVNKLIVIPMIGGGPYYPMHATTNAPGSPARGIRWATCCSLSRGCLPRPAFESMLWT